VRGVHASAYIDPSASVDPTACIGAFVYVGPGTKIEADVVLMPRVTVGANVTISAGSRMHSGVVIEDGCIIGARVIVHANSVIGSDGFSYITKEPSNLEKLRSGNFNFSTDRQAHEKILSAGNVIIEDDVEIGSCTTVDRGTLGPTCIGAGTKIDNHCQIAHNVIIGKDALIIANSGIAGSAKIGDRVTIAGGAGVGDSVVMANDSLLGPYSTTSSDVDAFMPVIGIPAVPYAEYMSRQRAYARLPKIREEVSALRKELNELKKA
jgi:UDP-3-O-[3-hydroxymyristoyl] glucosamine N-acyltransferase